MAVGLVEAEMTYLICHVTERLNNHVTRFMEPTCQVKWPQALKCLRYNDFNLSSDLARPRDQRVM